MPDQNQPITPYSPPVPGNPVGQEPQTPPPPPTMPSDDIAAPLPPQDEAGSSAPPFDIPPVVTPPTKPSGVNRKVIATILGLLVLVGGLTVGVVLVRQRQIFREKASGCDQTCLDNGGTTDQCCGQQAGCTSDADCGPGGTCKPDGTCVVPPPPGTCWDGSNSNPCPPKPTTCDRSICPYGCWADGGCKGPPSRDCTASDCGCEAGFVCVGKTDTGCSCQPEHTPYCADVLLSGPNKCQYGCDPSPSGGTCKTAPPQGGNGCQTDAQCQAAHPGEENWVCTGAAGSKTCNQGPPGFSSCPGGTCSRFYGFSCTSLTNGICMNNPQIFSTEGAATSAAGNCGQVDLACSGGSKDGQLCGGYTVFTSGCGGPPPPPPPPLPPPPPPPPPGPTAQCLNVKAFDTSWNQLTAAQLSALNPGDKVRFTVAGTATSGTFDKARFTINGTLRPEVTAVRPGTDEFYDEFTIPTGTTSFTVNAQIHHSTLGWF